jgi:hypothetical protein
MKIEMDNYYSQKELKLLLKIKKQRKIVMKIIRKIY